MGPSWSEKAGSFKGVCLVRGILGLRKWNKVCYRYSKGPNE